MLPKRHYKAKKKRHSHYYPNYENHRKARLSLKKILSRLEFLIEFIRKSNFVEAIPSSGQVLDRDIYVIRDPFKKTNKRNSTTSSSSGGSSSSSSSSSDTMSLNYTSDADEDKEFIDVAVQTIKKE